MDIDDFLNGGFQNLAEGTAGPVTDAVPAKLKAGAKRKASNAVAPASGGQPHLKGDQGKKRRSSEAAANPVNSKLKSEIKSHKAQLERLKEADPEFYKYLETSDKALLDFEDDSDDALDDESAGADGQEAEASAEGDGDDEATTSGSCPHLLCHGPKCA
jgi:hypothetical protein